VRASEREAYSQGRFHPFHRPGRYVPQAAHQAALIYAPQEIALDDAVFHQARFASGDWNIDWIPLWNVFGVGNRSDNGYWGILIAYVILKNKAGAGLLRLAPDGRIEIDHKDLAPDTFSGHPGP
jgi:hypothetical protein